MSKAKNKAVATEQTSFFDHLIDGFVSIFGSKPHFFLAVIALPLWIAPIFWIGYVRWTTVIGLTGNTFESTVEYYLAVATLYQAARITIKQNLQEQANRILLERIQTETDEIDKLLIENTTLTKEVHQLSEELRNTLIKKKS